MAVSGNVQRLHPSALEFATPGRWITSNSYSWSKSAQRASLPVSLVVVMIHLKGAWSVMRVNGLPNRNCRKCCTTQITARHSPLMGSVSSYCVAHAKCPVLAVPKDKKWDGAIRSLSIFSFGSYGYANSFFFHFTFIDIHQWYVRCREVSFVQTYNLWPWVVVVKSALHDSR